MEPYPTRPHTPFTKQNELLMKKLTKLRKKARKKARKEARKAKIEQEEWEGLEKAFVGDESSFKDTRRLEARGVRGKFAPLPKRSVTNTYKRHDDRGGTKHRSRKRNNRKRKSIKRKSIKRKSRKHKRRKHKRR